jgi:glycosyltransferase involved in cell wall biosynthesis
VRILHVIPSVSAIYGGPSRAIGFMTTALAAAGHDVDIATTNADGDRDLDVELGAPIVSEGVTTRYFSRHGRVSWKPSWSLGRWLWENVARYDVVHAHACFSYTTAAAAIAAEHARVPLVVRPLGTLDAWSIGEKRWKKAPYYALVERRNLVSAAAIHVTSTIEADGVARLGFAHKTVTIPIGVPVPNVVAPRARAGRPLSLLFLSRIHPKKGLPILLAAIAKARADGLDVTLTIAGNAEDGYEQVVDRRVVELGLGAHVTRVGYVDGAEKEALYAAADLFVLPSYQENFGIAVAEAMGRGVPVIVTDAVALASEVREVDAGAVVKVDDVEGLARAFSEFADDDRRLAAGRRARAMVIDRFSVPASARALASLYRRLAPA